MAVIFLVQGLTKSDLCATRVNDFKPLNKQYSLAVLCMLSIYILGNSLRFASFSEIKPLDAKKSVSYIRLED